jgi:hypothetical protein
MEKHKHVVRSGNGWRVQIEIRNQGSIYSKSCRSVEEAKQYVEPVTEVGTIIRLNRLNIPHYREGIRKACEFVKNMKETKRAYSRGDILRVMNLVGTTQGVRSGDSMVPVDQPLNSVKTEDVVDLEVFPHNDTLNISNSLDSEFWKHYSIECATKELRTFSEAYRRLMKTWSDACYDEVCTSMERLHVVIKLRKDSSANKRKRS